MRQLLVLSVAACLAHAHTLVRSIYVNGVDQGTNVGIRPPAMNGPPRAGSWPVKDLNLPGPAGDTEIRGPSDGIIDSSHKGAIPGLPGRRALGLSWSTREGNWAVSPKLISNRGVHSIPDSQAGLKSGQPDVAYTSNAARGVQIYTECVQIFVRGNGTVSFPGAYKYTDPGIVYNIYNPPSSGYKAPGPAVWSGAAASIANPPLGTKVGPLTIYSLETVTATGTAGLTKTTYNPVWPTQSAWGNVVGRETEAKAAPAQIAPAPTAV
ncbi:hypothetical protein FA13DRAFT_1736747 [Coprinellus micaceus]|uniref:AA9 family lytic polysaccharide monooxygenase n=1 Tax=Coprinellus micaceus TaxID=71717 RepID=A0A4Y7SZ71_COPMI|nr:hypothetical protein FA13DRAFT_1736747 [Coprinellus micaceus]